MDSRRGRWRVYASYSVHAIHARTVGSRGVCWRIITHWNEIGRDVSWMDPLKMLNLQKINGQNQWSKSNIIFRVIECISRPMKFRLFLLFNDLFIQIFRISHKSWPTIWVQGTGYTLRVWTWNVDGVPLFMQQTVYILSSLQMEPRWMSDRVEMDR